MPHPIAPPRPLSPPRRRRALVATCLGTAAVAATVLGPALPATAHVRVRADSPTTGSYAALTFRVPTESETASTVKVEVELPQDRPFASVSTRPVPGWRATVTEAALPTPVTSGGTTLTRAPRTVTWTATDRAAAVAPGQYQEFSISAGPLPGPGAILLPATQTYSDGKVVRWDQPTPASGEEPESPAPVVQVVDAGAPPSAAPAPVEAAVADAGPDPVARTLGGAALVVALAGLVLGVLRRRPAGGPR